MKKLLRNLSTYLTFTAALCLSSNVSAENDLGWISKNDPRWIEYNSVCEDRGCRYLTPESARNFNVLGYKLTGEKMTPIYTHKTRRFEGMEVYCLYHNEFDRDGHAKIKDNYEFLRFNRFVLAFDELKKLNVEEVRACPKKFMAIPASRYGELPTDSTSGAPINYFGDSVNIYKIQKKPRYTEGNTLYVR